MMPLRGPAAIAIFGLQPRSIICTLMVFSEVHLMSQPSLDERVAALEQEVARLTKFLPGERQLPKKDRRSTRGMFADDPIIKEIQEEGRKIRDRDRERPGE